VRELGELTASERAFVEASRRRLVRRRLATAAAIAAVPLVALAIFLGVRFEAARKRAREVAARVEAAAARHADAERLAGQAAAAREDAFRRFDADDEPGGEARWAAARRLSAEAHGRYAEAAAELEAAFLLDGAAARDQMARTLWAEAELAELEHDGARVDELVRRLAAYDPARAARWHAPGRIVITLDRPARITVHALSPGAGSKIAGGFEAQPRLARDGARLDDALPPGSYVAVIAAPDGVVVRDPFLLARGGRLDRAIAIPPRAAVPPGFVHVPEGDFFLGSSREEVREVLGAQPLRPAHGRAFLISRTEVTFESWIEYLRAQPPEERRALRPGKGGVILDEQDDGRFALSLEPAPRQRYRVREGEPLVYPGRAVRAKVRWERLPVTGVSAADALAYAAWLDRTGRVPGARLCTFREWEHAARGADGRSFPHGEELHPTDANIDATYGRVPEAFGADEVGSFPASDSPYGIADLAGNVWEVTTAERGKLWQKGGSFFLPAIAARSDDRSNPGEQDMGNARLGLRICADAAPAR
jgi:formylglycine-generating enzyme required for sulfatase activity